MKNLEMIDKAFEEIQNKKYVDVNLKSIQRIINRELKVNCQAIYIVQNDTSNYFFGMHIFPSKAERKRITDILINSKHNEKIENLREVIIEIDSKLLNNVGATPREITSVLLHEIGHKVHSNKDQARLRGLYAVKSAQLLTAGSTIITPVPSLISLFILKCFEGTLAYSNSLNGEIDADSYAIQCGYGKDLHSLLDKLRSLATTKDISLLRSRKDEEEATLNWTLKQTIGFKQRQKAIEKQLRMQEEIESSLEGKWALQDALDDFLNKDKKKKNIPKVMMNESIKSYIDMKKNGLSHLELREIEIEIQKINDYEDKLYVINRIFKAIKEVDRLIYLFNNPNDKMTDAEKKKMKNTSLKEVTEYKNQLNVMLDDVRNKKVRTKLVTQVEINVAYPKGYEG